MATLAESFLADLEDLSDGEGEEEEAALEGEDDAMDEPDDIEALNYDDLDAVAHLMKSDRYKTLMTKVRAGLSDTNPTPISTKVGAIEDNPDYQVIVDCNQLNVDVDNEITVIHNFIRDKYRLKFPELESLVMHPIDYARVVKQIANEMDMTQVDLDTLLPSATIMVVSVTGSTTNGKQLSEENLQKTLDACDACLELDTARTQILEFVESRMAWIAPNLSAVVGSEVAAKLMGLAGGLTKLSQMPACNVQVLGAKKKRLDGFATSSANPHAGYLFNTDIVQKTPPSLRLRATRLIAGKCTLMARVDSFGDDPAGSKGQEMLEEVQAKIEKWQEPPPAKQPKPLPVPDLETKKKRGGRRLRKMKERYGMTDMRKMANRVNFNEAEQEYGQSGEGGLGVLGSQAGGGKIRGVTAQQSKLAMKAAKKMTKEKKFGSSGASNGLSSSIAFTPIQGIELVNPTPNATDAKDGTESYFSEFGTFSKIRRII